jgi:hypothetical protein
MNRQLYKETQTFRQPWMWIFIFLFAAAAIVYFAIGINRQIIQGKPVGNNPLSDTGLIAMGLLTFLIVFMIVFLVMKAKLIVEISENSIQFRFHPFINKYKVIDRREIERFEVRKYRPIRDFGGWGIRTGFRKNGIAYNVSGNLGLQLYLINGKKILIGTQRKDAINRAMQKMMNEG